MSLTTRVLLALTAGIALGLALSRVAGPGADAVLAIVSPIGTLFVNAIRMTVIPLVVASLVVGIADAGSARTVARMGITGLVVFLALLIVSGLIGALASPPVFAHLPQHMAAVAHAGGGGAAMADVARGAESMRPAQWIASLVPSNVTGAARDGAMLPLIVFALLLGLALGTLGAAAREGFTTFMRAIAACMLVLVRWLLVVAPIGVFALAVPLVARLGFAAVGALAAYVAVVSIGAALLTVALYPIAAIGGGRSMREFARAAAPAQAVAFSSRSSIAALPALIETGRARLGLSEEVTGFFLPLASAVFRLGAALGLVAGVLFIARLYGSPLTGAQVATAMATSIVTSFSIPGIPGGSIIAMAPVLASVGLPLEGLGILLGVDVIPDIFRTTVNVTGQLAAAVIVERRAMPADRAPAAV